MKVAASFVCLFLIGQVAFGSSLQAGLGLPLENAGDRAFNRGDYSEAERYFREAWKKADAEHAPDFVRASVIGSLAQVLLTRGRLTESEELFNLALKIADAGVADPRVRAILLLNQERELPSSGGVDAGTTSSAR